MFNLLVLQRLAMDLRGVRSCLERRFVNVCLDAECLGLCKTFGIPNCVDLNITTQASDLGKADYAWITYVKHEILEAASQVATESIFLDTDTLVFDDPWSVNLNAPNGPYDLRYQHENEPENLCSGAVNGGQLYVRQSDAISRYFASLKAHKSEILDGQHGLDQSFVASAADAAGISRCALDPSYFIGHCGTSHLLQSDAKKVVTYHVNCAVGATQKWNLLYHFYSVRKAQLELDLDVTVEKADELKRVL